MRNFSEIILECVLQIEAKENIRELVNSAEESNTRVNLRQGGFAK